MNKDDIKKLQRDLNEFTRERLVDIAPLIVDGDFGHATRKRLRGIKYYLGYISDKRDDKADALPDKEFRLRLEEPNNAKHSSKQAVRRGKDRRERHNKLAREQRENWKDKKGFATFDGKTVAEWMITWLEKSRKAGWNGQVVSGVRTPAYSQHLCIAMCGRPSCPGTCAGVNSNHNMLSSQGYPHGALDVSDYANFEAIQKRIGSPLINRLDARDPVHFSVSGV